MEKRKNGEKTWHFLTVRFEEKTDWGLIWIRKPPVQTLGQMLPLYLLFAILFEISITTRRFVLAFRITLLFVARCFAIRWKALVFNFRNRAKLYFRFLGRFFVFNRYVFIDIDFRDIFLRDRPYEYVSLICGYYRSLDKVHQNIELKVQGILCLFRGKYLWLS